MRTSRRLYTFVCLASVTLFLVSCSIFPQNPRGALRYFALERYQCSPQDGTSTISAQSAVPSLLIAPPTADSAIDSDKIMYSKSPIERGFYQYSFWISSPVNQMNTLMRGIAFCRGYLNSGNRGPRLLLETRIIDFYHDSITSPGSARITLGGRVVDINSNKEVATQTFTYSEPVTEYSGEGAAQALSKAATAIAGEVIQWATDSVKQRGTYKSSKKTQASKSS